MTACILILYTQTHRLREDKDGEGRSSALLSLELHRAAALQREATLEREANTSRLKASSDLPEWCTASKHHSSSCAPGAGGREQEPFPLAGSSRVEFERAPLALSPYHLFGHSNRVQLGARTARLGCTSSLTPHLSSTRTNRIDMLRERAMLEAGRRKRLVKRQNTSITDDTGGASPTASSGGAPTDSPNGVGGIVGSTATATGTGDGNAGDVGQVTVSTANPTSSSSSVGVNPNLKTLTGTDSTSKSDLVERLPESN